MKLHQLTLLVITVLTSAQSSDKEIVLNQYRKAVHLGIGYAGGTGTEDFTKVKQNGKGTTYTFNNGSWGKGISLKLGYSYKIHPNLGLGIEGEGFVGLKSSLDNRYYEDSTQTSNEQTFSYSATNFRVMPYVQFDVPVSRHNAIYAKLGYVLGTGKMRYTSDERIRSATQNSFDVTYKYELNGGTIHGTNMALGFRFKVGEMMSFFTELNISALKQKVKQENMVAATSDGQNVLPYIDKYYTTTNYVDELVVSNNYQINYDQPDQQLAYQAIHSAVGISLGLNFYFSE